MSFVHHLLALGLVLACSAVAPNSLHAQDWSEASSLYSQGVHAYFAGRSSDAESYLSRALAIETTDPRLYYFRALALMRLGRMDEARGDLMVGARLEARQPNRFPIGMALQRVQGSNRLLLEQHRRQGRADEATSRAQMRRQRYPQTFGDESQVLRQKIIIPMDELMRPGGPRPLPPEELAKIPLATPHAGTAGTMPPAAEPTAPDQSAADNPFGDDPQEPTSTPAVTESAPTEDTPADTSSDDEAADTESMPTTEEDEDPFSGV